MGSGMKRHDSCATVQHDRGGCSHGAHLQWIAQWRQRALIVKHLNRSLGSRHAIELHEAAALPAHKDTETVLSRPHMRREATRLM